jgi:hypothetical protein
MTRRCRAGPPYAHSMNDLRRAAVSFAVALAVSACGAGTQPSIAGPTVGPTSPPATTANPTTTAAPSADLEHPVGMIAVGHSGLTGEGTADLHEANFTDSWATGDDPAVNSIYQRLAVLTPAILGHVANNAHGGASASALVAQVRSALVQVPVPTLAIVTTIDNDVLCDQSNMAKFGKWITDGLNEIHSASPNTKILIIDQLGRPRVDFVKRLVAEVPTQKAAMTWDDECTFYLPDGTLNEPGFATLTVAIDAYEAEQARVCATIPNCSTDGGVAETWVDKLEYLSADYGHLNVVGQAAEAEHMWPVVKDLLGL